MLRYLIIEDEPLAAKALQNLLTELRPSWYRLDVLDSIEASVKYLKTSIPDLIFMDIHLADGLSFKIFEKSKIDSPVIFTTAYDQYAVKAFKVNGLDYLLKPIEPQELKRAVEKFEESRKGAEVNIRALMEHFSKPAKEYKSRFLIKVADKLISIPTESVNYFFSDEKHTWLVQGKEHYPVDYTLEALEENLDPSEFFRLNRKIFAGYASIQKIFNHFNGKLKLELNPAFGEEVFVSRERAREFKEWLDK